MLLTAAGHITLCRVYFVCRTCREGGHPFDDRVGVNGSTSPQAERMISLAGGSWSYDLSAKHLAEFCGLKVSDNKIRDVCQSQGAKMARWQRETSETRETFKKAKGEHEFTTDGTCVNTWDGWREMRVGIFSKRPKGESAKPEEWADRELPSTTVRVAFAAIEKSDRFGSRWGQWASRLGIRDTSQLSVLADGARWIWEESSMHFAGHRGCLDIFHALEHVSDSAKALFPHDAEAAEQWQATCRDAILSGGESVTRAQRSRNERSGVRC
jgi:hypothetical protein